MQLLEALKDQDLGAWIGNEVKSCVYMASALLSKLQVSCKHQGEHAYNASVLSACTQLASIVHSTLVAAHEASRSPQQHELEQKAVKRLLRACQSAIRALPVESAVPQLLAQAVQGDVQAIACVAHDIEAEHKQALAAELSVLQDSLTQQQGMSDVSKDALVACVRALRGLERSVMAQAELHADMEATFDSTDYSLESLSYGSTPWSSFLTVMSDQVVQHELQAAGMGSAGSKCFKVWGASSGWLVFYAHLTFGWVCRGVELLPSQVARAQHVQRGLLPGSHGSIAFECGDLLNSTLDGVGALMLTNQCWDAKLNAAAAKKAAAELASQSVVVSYVALNHEGLKLATKVMAPVSWNPQQRFYVYTVA